MGVNCEREALTEKTTIQKLEIIFSVFFFCVSKQFGMCKVNISEFGIHFMREWGGAAVKF